MIKSTQSERFAKSTAFPVYCSRSVGRQLQHRTRELEYRRCGSGPIGGGGGGGGGGGHRRVAISLHHLDIVSSDVYFSTLLNAENKN
ncbi:hypothetical protein T4B_13461 [Trichinella pseudospiralis]|uniref:Uncharacterized protein n=1 Tax=Trichinella pseudospiralis TaxID=6337 RepID=A0A0V1IVZ8_TRIPS|nr:hypothetical protein T4B_13461 [Trichinella pseudospiralis]